MNLTRLFSQFKKDLAQTYKIKYENKIESQHKKIKTLEKELKSVKVLNSPSKYSLVPSVLRNELIWRLYNEGINGCELALEFNITRARIYEIYHKMVRQHRHNCSAMLIHRPDIQYTNKNFPFAKYCPICREIIKEEYLK